tara:strand:- start:531 stop:791 length:261 start_codon:yes stop_codon:yes gene_type:complete
MSKPQLTEEQYKLFLRKFIDAYQKFDELRTIFEEYDVDGYFDPTQIDECLSILESNLGWTLATRNEFLKEPKEETIIKLRREVNND